MVGASGAVGALELVHSECGTAYQMTLANHLTQAQLDSVIMVKLDRPGPEAEKCIRSVCRNLVCLSLDPMHICYAFEQSLGRQRSQGAKVLRSIMRKFRCRSQQPPHALPPLFDGTKFRFRHAVGSAAIRDQIDNTSMPLDEATTVIENINDGIPYVSRIEVLRAVAAFVAFHKDEVNRP